MQPVMINQRYAKNHPCPICGGYDEAPRGHGVRCYGYVGYNGDYAYCTNDLYAGTLDKAINTDAYLHALNRPCNCGQQHTQYSIPISPKVPLDIVKPIPYSASDGFRSDNLGGYGDMGMINWDAPSVRYNYQDEEGATLFSVLRWDGAEGKTIRQGRKVNGEWERNLQNVSRPYPLYRLPLINRSSIDTPVVIVEGEKCADRLIEEGFVATTTMGGAGKARHSDLSPLEGRLVYIIPDQDEVGQSHAEDVQARLIGVARRASIVQLPSMHDKADVVDYLDDGGSAEGLRVLMGNAPQNLTVISASGTVYDWEEPVEFGTFDLPKFPLELLPDWLRSACEEVTRKNQTPTDLAGMLALAVISTCIAGKVKVEARPGWFEHVMMYVLVVLNPAQRKTPVYNYMTAPISLYQDAKQDEVNSIAAPLIEEKDTLERELEGAKNRAAKFCINENGREDAFVEVRVLANKVADMDVPVPPTLFVDECTPEAVVPIMEENEGRMAVLSDEGDAVSIMIGRYSAGDPRLGVYKKGYDGGRVSVRRMSRQNNIRSACLTIGITTQEETLRTLGKTDKVKGEGFLGRFCYALPENKLGTRDDEQPEIDDAVTDTYHEHVNALLELPWRTDEDGQNVPYILKWTPEAFELFNVYTKVWLEPRLADPAEFGLMTDWAGKLGGRTARIAANLHYAEHIGKHPNPATLPISRETVRKAIYIARNYIVPHAKAAYDLMEQEKLVQDAQKVLDNILAKKLTSFTAIDAWKPFKTRYAKSEDFLPILTFMADYGYIRLVPDDDVPAVMKAQKRQGRPPKHLYEVNPIWLAAHEEGSSDSSFDINELLGDVIGDAIAASSNVDDEEIAI